MTEYHSFEEFLKDMHSGQYTGTDDDMPDNYEHWLAQLDVDGLIEYADEYAAICEEQIKHKMTRFIQDMEPG